MSSQHPDLWYHALRRHVEASGEMSSIHEGLMLSYGTSHWVSFLIAATLLDLTPGVDMAFILGHTFNGGRRAGAVAMLGTWSGALCHVAFAAVGLSALIIASATAFSTLKWAGVVYLVWIGFSAIVSKGGNGQAPASSEATSAWRIYRQGVLVDLLNPKVAFFFLAFLPQFVEADAGPTWLQLTIHGLLIIVIAAIVEIPIVWLGDRLSGRLRRRQRPATWLSRAFGVTMIGLGIKLATSAR